MYKRVSCLYRLVLIAVLLAVVGRSWADSGAMMFQHIYKDIAPGEIQEFFQDDRGYMWVGARNSLFRYNAYEFKEIFVEEGQGAEIKLTSPHFTTEIFQDSAGEIWVTSHSGLFLLDRDREVLKKVTTKAGYDLPMYSENTHDIAELATGNFIFGLNDGFAIIDRESLVATRYVISDYVESFVPSTVYKIILDGPQRVWFGTRTGLIRYDLESDDLKYYIPDPNNPSSQVDNALWSLAVAKDGKIWGGTLGAGLYIFDPELEQFERVRSGQDNARGLAEDTIWDIMRDSRGAMWLAHDRNGLSRYDPQRDRFDVYLYNLGQSGSLIYNSVRTSFEDKDGNFWVGHYPGGISFHDRSDEAIRVYRQDYQNPSSLGNPNVQAVMEDQGGNFWVAVGDGIDYFDRDSGNFKHYRKNLGTYPANGSLSGYLDKKGRVWIGTWTEGYHRYNPDKDLFEALSVDPSLAGSELGGHSILNDSTIWGFCETTDNHLWIGTHYAGINRYDDVSKTFTKFKNLNNDNSLSNNIAWACFEDSKGRFWVGTAWGLSLMDRERETFKNYRPQEGALNQLQSGSVMAIYEDRSGQLWFGTDSGLALYRESTDDFKVFTEDDGLANKGIRAITGDHNGNLWLGTNSGIVRFDPHTYEAKNYLEHVGQKFSGINTGAALTTKKGEIVFGSIEGLILIDPDKLSMNSKPPPVVFTQFNVFTKPVAVGGPDGLLASAIDRTSSVTLDYTKKMFSFEFSALNYRSAEKNQYSYKLEGFDHEWRDIGVNRRAQYTNLSAGRYVFRVRASNNDGVWNDSGVSINIVQLPPPWKTWWAYLIYSICVLALIGYFINNQRRKRRIVEEQNKMLELRVAERTADLAKKNKDIQSMLTNMRQGLFTIEESGAIHHEYSAQLESIYETENIAGNDAIEFMFSGALVDNDVLDQIEVCVCSIIGMDEMNYQLNSHLLVKEYQKIVNGKTKYLSLDWSPIVDDEIVSKLMVSVRDITEIKVLEEEAEGKKRELNIISQLLSLDVRKYKSYMRSSRQYLSDCVSWLSDKSEIDKATLDHLFRCMHTIKGNSRTLGFTYIANVAHNAESTYSGLQKGELKCDRARLLSELSDVEKSLSQYELISTEALGRGDEESNGEDGVWIPENIFTSIQAGLKKLKPYDERSYVMLQKDINSCLARPMEKVLSSNINALASIAEELGKAPPNLSVSSGGILVKEAVHGLLNDVFSHLFRNAIDHGIESPKDRLEKGVNRQGSIKIALSEADSTVEIRLIDDGRGLDLNSLFIKGVESGSWSMGDTVTTKTLTDLIFDSGVSTHSSVTEISGRGVGMDAVKHFLLEVGGDIHLELESSADSYELKLNQRYVKFSTCIVLPKKYFVVDEE